MKRQLFRLLAVVCSLALVLTIIPLSVSAEDIALESDYVSSELTAESSKLDIVPILDENTSLREESTKYFRRADGTTTAAIYNRPIHYLQDGQWKDIDNTLISDGEENGVAYYTNQANAFKVRIPEKLNSSAPITVSHNGYTLTWSLLEGESNTAVVTPIHQPKEEMRAITTIGTSGENSSTRVVNENKMQVHKQHSSVEYKNIQKGVHLSYDVIGNQLKESIILDKYQSNARYTFFVRTGRLIAALQEDNSVHFYDGKELVFIIASPYMLDANDEFSQDIEVQIKAVAGGYQYTVIPSDDWLASADRQYPVTIDPTVQTSIKANKIESVQTYSRYPTENYDSSHLLYTGSVLINDSSVEEYRTYVKLAMPVPETSYRRRVIDAKLYLNYFDEYNVRSQGTQINMYRVTGDWDETTLTWDTRPTCESTATDYLIGRNGSGECVLDITTLANDWINDSDTNHGVVFKITKKHTTKHDTICWYSDNTNEEAYGVVRPQAVITYRDCTGIEDYWSYTSVSAGAAGTALVNNYAGDLVFTAPLFNGTGERMPLSLSAVYNGYSTSRVFATDLNNNSQTSLCRGWRLNIQQTLLPSSAFGLTGTAANNFPYVYTDGDGTHHYIAKVTENSATVYRDEDGLGLTLTHPSSSTYLLTDEKGNTIKFNSVGNVTQIADANDNAITVTYQPAASASAANNHEDVLAGQKIDYITDGAGLKYQFVYYETSSGGTNNYIRKITDSAGRSVIFTRDEQLLKKITYPDGTATTFSSSSSSPYCLNSVTDTNGYKVSFTYSSSTEARRRISTIQEYSSSGTAGQKIVFNYSLPNETTIRSMGRDNKYGNDDDIIKTYQFDRVGRVTSYKTRFGNGDDSLAGVTAYTDHDNTASNLKQRNLVTSSASLNKNSINLVTNGNAESTTGWTLSKDGATSTSTVVAGGLYGQKALRLSTTAVNSGGGSSDLRQNVSGLTGGTTYTLSAYVKMEGVAVTKSADDTGVYIAIRTINGASVARGYSTRLTTNTNTEINNGWRRISATLTLPSDCTSVRVALAARNITGTVYFDGIQLETGNMANAYNMLENSSFEKFPSGGGMPTSWTPVNCEYTVNSSSGTVYDGCSTVTKKNGSYSVRLTGVHDTSVGISQNIPITGSANDTYIVSGWAAGFPVDTTSHSGRFEITAYVGYTNANGDFHEELVGAAEFNTNITGWQYSAFAFNLGTYQSGYTPTRIRIRPTYSKQANHAYFDFVHLYRDVAQSYTYDSKGNLTSVAANAEQKSAMSYTGYNLVSATDAAGYACQYTYDANNNVATATSARGVKTIYERNALGQVVDIQIKSGTSVLRTQTEHNDAKTVDGVTVKAGAYTDAVIDQYGERTTYDIDLLRGRTKSVTNTKDITTSYTYVSNDDDRVKSVSSNGSSVSYTYSGSRLSGLTFGGDTYAFTVDGFGNAKKTTVGGKSLSTNTYADHNGQLTQVAYGNGDKRTYAYTRLGQVSSVGDGTDTLYTWQYNGNGETVAHSDLVNNLTYRYDRDTIGRLIRQEITNQSTGAYKGAVEHSYDVRNNLIDTVVDMGTYTAHHRHSYSAISGLSATTGYAKDNLLTRSLVFSNRYVDFGYDSINRLKRKELSTSTPLVTQYMYRTSTRGEDSGITYRTTGLYAEYIDDTAYRYSYDKLGNITGIDKASIADPNASSVSVGSYANYRDYTYDNLSQLTKSVERFSDGTITTTYAYDKYGNITSKSVTKDGTTTTYAYTYGTDSDAGWSKLLKSYNGHTIDYDAIGNPISYMGATMEWSNGRQLTKYTKDGSTTRYTYDADGLRATKTVDGVKHTYLYVGGQLLYEKWSDKELYFWYDGNGHLMALRYYYNDDGDYSTLYAMTNAMGDVLGLYSVAGNPVVTYEYDAWGRLINLTDNTSLGTGTINPIRYRGYYYDTDSGLYYCQSRYYNPRVGRWVNADRFISTGRGLLGYNMYTYCNNNPLIFKDDTGSFPWLVIGALAIFAIGGGIWGYQSNYKLWDPPKPENQKTPEEATDETVVQSPNLKETTSELPKEESVLNTEKSPLSTGDRIANTFIGAGVGLAIGGAVVATAGAAGAIIAGSATTTIAAFGATGAQTFAIGALAYNFFAMVVAPFLGIEMEPIEYTS